MCEFEIVLVRNHAEVALTMINENARLAATAGRFLLWRLVILAGEIKRVPKLVGDSPR